MSSGAMTNDTKPRITLSLYGHFRESHIDITTINE